MVSESNSDIMNGVFFCSETMGLWDFGKSHSLKVS